MERLVADFSVDPEEILPEAGTLESAKSYQKKKEKFLLAKIVQELRSLYHKYIELKGKFDRRLWPGTGGQRSPVWTLDGSKNGNKALRQISADYERIFSPEQVAAVEADKQRE